MLSSPIKCSALAAVIVASAAFNGASAQPQVSVSPSAGPGVTSVQYSGRSGVYINGQEIPRSQAIYLSRLFGAYRPGSYLLDRRGNLYHANGVFIANIPQLMARGGSTYVPGGGGGTGMHIGPGGCVMTGDYISPSC